MSKLNIEYDNRHAYTIEREREELAPMAWHYAHNIKGNKVFGTIGLVSGFLLRGSDGSSAIEDINGLIVRTA